MKKIYYLSTCSTCKNIMQEWNVDSSFELQDIKTQAISPAQLDEMKDLAGSYEALFSRKSRQYTARDLKTKALEEKDYKDLILEEYTFLKRPVLMVENEIFIGNSKENVAKAKKFLKIISN